MRTNAPFILASMALQVLTALAFTATMVGLTIKLRHAMMRSASLAWCALVAHLSLWWIAAASGVQGQLAGFVLAAGIVAGIAVFGAFAVDAVTRATALDAPPSTVRWQRSALIGAVLGFSGHYWAFHVAASSSPVRHLWLRGIVVLVFGGVAAHAVRALRSSPVARHRIRPLLIGVTCTFTLAIVDGALRYTLARGGAPDGVAVAAVFSAFLGTFALGIGMLTSVLHCERDVLGGNLERIQVHLQRGAENERMQSIGRLATGLAQSIEAQLAGIDAAVQRAGSALAESPTSMHDDLDEAARAIQRGTRLAQRLAGLTRHSAATPDPVDVAAQVQGMSLELSRLLPATLQLHTIVQSSREARVDRERLGQMVLNLVVNARDAMPAGGEVVVRVRDVDVDAPAVLTCGAVRPGPYIAVDVQDGGTGIAPSLQPLLFEPFFTTKGDQGTGLGLATVANAVHECEGALSLDSVVDRGSLFTLWIPAAGAPTRSTAQQRAA